MAPRQKLLVLLPLVVLALVSTYILCAPAQLSLGSFGGNSADPKAATDDTADSAPNAAPDAKADPAAPVRPSGIAYYLPVAQFADSRYLRMNTILNKSIKVCDKTTLETVDKKIVDNMMCDVVIEAERGWGKLCSKTRAMIDHLCSNGGLGNKEFFIKVDDDTMIDPRIEDYIQSEMSGKDVFFGFSPGYIEAFTKYHTWFGGPFYGFSASVLKQICSCAMPDCPPNMGEDQWAGYMLGECNITKEDILLPQGYVYHREYKAPRVSIEFHRFSA
ncbi:hypothetical protein LPJ61_001812 [Coemansia biformis]|uniref:Hexosyltransferase n=1 Tax=Coemansia biformis TaxID=1286918 RepID=A0A9W7YGZ4_9FUNG|nr:hypothetical protein LPJ61_001812 [Coemansia biformis]